MHLEQAIQMIRQMSANHLCAQRAYKFLEQLVGVLDNTLPEDRQRPTSRVGRVSTAPTSKEPAVAGGEGAEDMMVPDLWSFWGATQDLTTDLASQLEMHSTLGSGIWSWDLQNPGPEQAALLPSPSGGTFMTSIAE